MKICTTIMLSLLLSLSICNSQDFIRTSFDLAADKYVIMAKNTPSYTLFPRSQKSTQEIVYVKASDWTSGFYPGNLWYLYEYKGYAIFKDRAMKFTASLEDQKNNTGTHDLGFMMYLSYGHGYRITGDSHYADVLVQSAKSLRSRYNQTTGCIRSWDFGDWEFPVIIDNMMNLELLFWATKYTGDSSYYKIAVSHANKTMQHHYRDDHSCYHVVNYSESTGAPISKETFQGNSDESAWSRGQAWGFYGFTMCYRETGITAYLEMAEILADYFTSNLPEDKIPYWDFDLTGTVTEPRDASAAAIFASGLIELYMYTNKSQYLDLAKEIMENLSSDAYFDKPLNKEGNLLLKHSTGHKPHNSEIDVPLIYADYYYLEALSRLIELETTSIPEKNKPSHKALSLYPNPTSDYITIPQGQDITRFIIYDSTGKARLSREYTPEKIDLRFLESGIYIIVGEIKGNQNRVSGHFIKS